MPSVSVRSKAALSSASEKLMSSSLVKRCAVSRTRWLGSAVAGTSGGDEPGPALCPDASERVAAGGREVEQSWRALLHAVQRYVRNSNVSPTSTRHSVRMAVPPLHRYQEEARTDGKLFYNVDCLYPYRPHMLTFVSLFERHLQLERLRSKRFQSFSALSPIACSAFFAASNFSFSAAAWHHFCQTRSRRQRRWNTANTWFSTASLRTCAHQKQQAPPFTTPVSPPAHPPSLLSLPHSEVRPLALTRPHSPSLALTRPHSPSLATHPTGGANLGLGLPLLRARMQTHARTVRVNCLPQPLQAAPTKE